MKKNIFKIIITIVIVIGIILIASFYFYSKEDNSIDNSYTGDFFECLASEGVIIYGSMYCPACSELVNSLGGYEKIAPVYLECEDNMDRCMQELKSGYVPEIQINGELYLGQKTIEGLAGETGCNL